MATAGVDQLAKSVERADAVIFMRRHRSQIEVHRAYFEPLKHAFTLCNSSEIVEMTLAESDLFKAGKDFEKIKKVLDSNPTCKVELSFDVTMPSQKDPHPPYKIKYSEARIDVQVPALPKDLHLRQLSLDQ